MKRIKKLKGKIMNEFKSHCKCGKQVYESQSDALNDIKLRNRSVKKIKLTKAYICIDSNNWHITSKESRVQKMRTVIRESNSDLKKYALKMFRIYQYEQKLYRQQLNF